MYINLDDRHDQEFLKNLYKVVEAFKIVSDTEQREEYIKMIRLRSFASQYMN